MRLISNYLVYLLGRAVENNISISREEMVLIDTVTRCGSEDAITKEIKRIQEKLEQQKIPYDSFKDLLEKNQLSY